MTVLAGGALSSSPPDGSAPALLVEGASKSFAMARVLQDASVTVARGEVRALIGANGSGKSTLIKLLSGYHSPDRPFRFEVGGAPLPTPSTYVQLQSAGVRFVHQHLPFAPAMSVLENICMGTFVRSSLVPIRWRREAKRARLLLERYGLTEIDLRQTVGELSAVQQTLLALVSAFDEGEDGGRASVIVLDEVTASLPADGVARVHELVRTAQAHGIGFLVVSHRLDEIRELADTVTALRDGHIVLEAAMAATDHSTLVDAIVQPARRAARRVETRVKDASPRPCALRVSRVSGPRCRDISFDLGAGEILGISGLLGMGLEEIGPLLYGLLPGDGQIAVTTPGGGTVRLTDQTPARALSLGIGFLSGDRARYGGWGAASVKDNLTLPYVGQFFRGLRLRHRDENQFARELMATLDVTPLQPELPLGLLSGGNQQKVLMGRALERAGRILLLDEPTAGVDVGARRELMSALRDYASKGGAIIYACGDAEEIAEMCDRVLVLHRGRIVSEIVSPFGAADVIDEVWRERENFPAR